MPEAGHKVATEYLEIDHPWVSHRHVPIYEWTFPSEATDEELDAFAQARATSGWSGKIDHVMKDLISIRQRQRQG